MNILSAIQELWRGKDSYRIFMNNECRHHAISGKVLDVGSGLKLASYHRFLTKAPQTDIHFLDLTFALGLDDEQLSIDLEQDALPYEAGTIDTVLLFNVLEHLSNYHQVLNQTKRILRPGGQLLGVVPFLVNYHPDPHDYWRFTEETLRNILRNIGFRNITITAFGAGPFVAGWSHVEQVIPKVFKVILFPIVMGLDGLVKKLRPNMNKEKFSLGYFFSASP